MLGAGEDAIIVLKQKFIGYGHVTPQTMFRHLQGITSIKLLSVKKFLFKKQGCNKHEIQLPTQ